MSAIDDFAADYLVVNQISPKRSRRHVAFLRDFEGWLGRPIEQAQHGDIERWMTEAIATGTKATTVRWRLMMLRPFYRWCWRRQTIDAETWLRIQDLNAPRGGAPRFEPKPYTTKEIKLFWAELAKAWPLTTERFITRFRRGTSSYSRVRAHGMNIQIRAIICLALYCGLRREEIWKLSLDDMHPDNAYLVVHGKREDHAPKVREVPYNPAAREAVRDWFRWRRMLAPTHNFPWLSLDFKVRAKEMRRRRFDDLLQTVHHAPGGDEYWKYHRFRHTCATERLRAGMEIEVLQRFLGHARIQQTLAYAKIVREDIAKSIDRTDEDFMRAVGPGKEKAA